MWLDGVLHDANNAANILLKAPGFCDFSLCAHAKRQRTVFAYRLIMRSSAESTDDVSPSHSPRLPTRFAVPASEEERKEADGIASDQRTCELLPL